MRDPVPKITCSKMVEDDLSAVLDSPFQATSDGLRTYFRTALSQGEKWPT